METLHFPEFLKPLSLQDLISERKNSEISKWTVTVRRNHIRNKTRFSLTLVCRCYFLAIKPTLKCFDLQNNARVYCYYFVYITRLTLRNVMFYQNSKEKLLQSTFFLNLRTSKWYIYTWIKWNQSVINHEWVNDENILEKEWITENNATEVRIVDMKFASLFKNQKKGISSWCNSWRRPDLVLKDN